MKLGSYFKDRSLYLILHTFLYLLFVIVIYLFKSNLFLAFILFLLWYLPLYLYIIIEYINLKTLFKSTYLMMDRLDQLYLLPELLEDVDRVEAKFIHDVLKQVSKDMHEHVKTFEKEQEEYQEYIEMWVHEIKTPIASTKLIIENNKNDVTQRINEQIHKIETFIQQALYYAKSSNVNADYIIKELNIEHIVQDVIKENARDLITKKIKVELINLNHNVYTDRMWIKFILNQLVINAIKYNTSNYKILRFAITTNESNFVLSVEDNGVGIPAKDINSIFKKGFTGMNGRTFGSSTGIGLYLCKKLCDKLGLGINIESIEHSGTKVNIIIPKGKYHFKE